MINDLSERPIVREILKHTGRLDGDDSGYREVTVSALDSEQPDSLVALNPIVPCYAVYAHGARSCITHYYAGGLGAPETVLVRQPVAHALKQAHEVLAAAGRGVLVLDGWRPVWVQARLWRDVFQRLVRQAGRQQEDLSPQELIRLGRKADDTASFCQVVKDERCAEALVRIQQGGVGEELRRAADNLGEATDRIAMEFMTFQANLGRGALSLDVSANTAHGGGGACDVWLLELDTQRPSNLGVPFDSTTTPAVMDYFEWATVAEYQEEVARDTELQGYLADFAIDPFHLRAEDFQQIRAARRLLYHTMAQVGATFFSLGKETGEPWHFNFGNERGGQQAHLFPGAGNGCHSLLKDVRDPTSGEWIATWGNKAAHRLAAQLLPEIAGPRDLRG